MYYYCSHFTIRGIETQRDDASWSRSYDKWYIVIGTVWCPYRLPWWLRWYSICYVAFLYYNFFSWEDLLHLAIIPTWQQPPQDKWQMALWFTSASPVRSLILPAWPLWALSTWQQVPKFYLWTRPSSELHGILASYPLNTWMSHRELKLYTTETPHIHTHSSHISHPRKQTCHPARIQIWNLEATPDSSLRTDDASATLTPPCHPHWSNLPAFFPSYCITHLPSFSAFKPALLKCLHHKPDWFFPVQIKNYSPAQNLLNPNPTMASNAAHDVVPTHLSHPVWSHTPSRDSMYPQWTTPSTPTMLWLLSLCWGPSHLCLFAWLSLSHPLAIIASSVNLSPVSPTLCPG